MKHIFGISGNKFFVLFLACLFIVCACTKSDKKQEESEPQEEESDALFVIAEPGQELAVILTDASLQELRDDGKMYWKANLSAGDTVVWKNEEKEAIRSYDGLKRTFYRVYMDGDYWVQDYAIEGPAMPAVITVDETILYTQPDLTAVARRGNISIPKYTLVALMNDDDPADQFAKISAWLDGTSNPAVTELYVKADNVSSDYNDIGCVKLARIASVTKNPAARKELLKNAMEMAEKSRRLNMVAVGLNDEPALFELELTNNLDRLEVPVNYIISSDTVNIRDLPSVDSNVVGVMSWGDSFWVSLQTKREITLAAAEEGAPPPKGRWLRTEDGNWVFGAYAVLPAAFESMREAADN